ncbi:MAG: hypothetical protein R6V07_11755 [Armatimonadota bacterium]
MRRGRDGGSGAQADGDEAEMDWRTALGVIWITAVLALHLRALVQGLFG